MIVEKPKEEALQAVVFRLLLGAAPTFLLFLISPYRLVGKKKGEGDLLWSMAGYLIVAGSKWRCSWGGLNASLWRGEREASKPTEREKKWSVSLLYRCSFQQVLAAVGAAASLCNMERLLLAPSVVQSTTQINNAGFVQPQQQQQQQHSSGSSSGSGSSLVEFLNSGRSSIDLNGVVPDTAMMIGGLATATTATQSVAAGMGRDGGEEDDENDVMLGVNVHHGPSYYDQNLVVASASAVLLHHQQQTTVGDLAVSMHHDCDDDDPAAIIDDSSDFAWMKDKKVGRKNSHRKWQFSNST